MGQMINQFGKLVPKAYQDTFENMFMQAPQTRFTKVVQILKEELQITDLGQVFSEFDPEPIASASLA